MLTPAQAAQLLAQMPTYRRVTLSLRRGPQAQTVTAVFVNDGTSDRQKILELHHQHLARWDIVSPITVLATLSHIPDDRYGNTGTLKPTMPAAGEF